MASYRDVRSAVTYSSDESSSDSDADADDQPWKRLKTSKQPQGTRGEAAASRPGGPGLPFAGRGQGESAPAGGGADAMTKKKPRRNNIWGQVALEQTEAQVAQEMDGFDMDLPRSRDVESYDYRLGWDDDQDNDEPGGRSHRSHLGAPSVTKLESGRPQGLKRGLGETEEDGWLDDRASDEQDEDEDDEGGGDRDIAPRKPVHERLGTREPAPARRLAKARPLAGPPRGRSPSPDSPMKFVEIEASLERKELTGRLAYSLQEDKRELIVRVVNVLGVDKSLELWRRTADVEKSGGMLVMNGSRRRAPGGVFLQLMKTDPEVAKSQVREIFAEERKKENEQKHKRDRRRRKQVAQCKDTEDGEGDGRGLRGDGGDGEGDGGLEEGAKADRYGPEGVQAPSRREHGAARDERGVGSGDMEDGEIEEEEEEMG